MLDYFGKKYGRSIEAIAVRTYNHSVLLADKDGTPLTRVITHHDTRAAEVKKSYWRKPILMNYTRKPEPLRYLYLCRISFIGS
ncbi:MAG: hypothetical protein QXZ66_08340 [Thermoproteota archaeon]